MSSTFSFISVWPKNRQPNNLLNSSVTLLSSSLTGSTDFYKNCTVLSGKPWKIRPDCWIPIYSTWGGQNYFIYNSFFPPHLHMWYINWVQINVCNIVLSNINGGENGHSQLHAWYSPQHTIKYGGDTDSNVKVRLFIMMRCGDVDHFEEGYHKLLVLAYSPCNACVNHQNMNPYYKIINLRNSYIALQQYISTYL